MARIEGTGLEQGGLRLVPRDEQLAVERLFEIQDGIAANSAATVAQPYDVVYRDARDQLQRRPPESLRAYECLLQAYAYRRHIARGPPYPGAPGAVVRPFRLACASTFA